MYSDKALAHFVEVAESLVEHSGSMLASADSGLHILNVVLAAPNIVELASSFGYSGSKHTVKRSSRFK